MSTPEWKANPDLPSVGFDIQVDDMDSPGLYGHDAGPKATLFALVPQAHFTSPENLGHLLLDQTVTQSRGTKEPVDTSAPGYEKARSTCSTTLMNQMSESHHRARRSAIPTLRARLRSTY